MCKFASFEVTKDGVFWSPTSDSHNDIIEHYKLHADGIRGPNCVSVEISPPRDCDWTDLAAWEFVVDQDIKPEWFDAQDVERRTRDALARRAADEWPWLPLIAVERKAAFEMVTCTDPADCERAEKVAKAMAKIGGLKGNMAVTWVASPVDGGNAYDSLRDSLRASLRASLSDSLRDSLGASLGASLRASLSDSLRDSLRASLRASLRDSLRASLRDSLSDSLRDSLRASLSDSYWDAAWMCMYDVGAKIGAVYTPENAALLEMHRELQASCYAMWLLPGQIILCERPSHVEIAKTGKVIDMKWERTAGEKGGAG